MYKETLSVSARCVKSSQCPCLDNVVTNDGDLRLRKKVIDRFSGRAHRFLQITMVISAALALLEVACPARSEQFMKMQKLVATRGKWPVKVTMAKIQCNFGL